MTLTEINEAIAGFGTPITEAEQEELKRLQELAEAYGEDEDEEEEETPAVSLDAQNLPIVARPAGIKYSAVFVGAEFKVASIVGQLARTGKTKETVDRDLVVTLSNGMKGEDRVIVTSTITEWKSTANIPNPKRVSVGASVDVRVATLESGVKLVNFVLGTPEAIASEAQLARAERALRGQLLLAKASIMEDEKAASEAKRKLALAQLAKEA